MKNIAGETTPKWVGTTAQMKNTGGGGGGRGNDPTFVSYNGMSLGM